MDHTAAALVARSDGTLWYRQSRSVYQQVHGLSEVQAVAASAKQNAPGNRVYVITNDGSLLGLNGIVGRREKVLDGVIDVSAGWDHVLALKEDGRVFAWGSNQLGQRGGQGDTNAWVDVGLTGVQRVAAGHLISMALMRDSTVCCWGILRPERARGTSVIVPMRGPSGITAIAAAGASNFSGYCAAASASGEVFAWAGAGTLHAAGGPDARPRAAKGAGRGQDRTLGPHLRRHRRWHAVELGHEQPGTARARRPVEVHWTWAQSEASRRSPTSSTGGAGPWCSTGTGACGSGAPTGSTPGRTP